MRTALAAALLAAIAAAGAAAGEGDVLERDCGTRVESGRAPFSFRGRDSIEAGPVSFWLLRRAASGIGTRWEDGRFFVKTHISVRAGHSVTVSVTDRYRDRLGLVRTSSDEPVAAVRFVPCPPAARAWSYAGRIGPVTGFNAGFKLARRGCYPLDVREAGGRVHRIRVAFGYPCR